MLRLQTESEVNPMTRSQAAQTREELTGLLIAISIVSKRLAESLKKLDAGRESTTAHEHAKSPC